MKYYHHGLQSQVYLVAGGLTGPRMRGSLRSTELLVKGGAKWKLVRRRITNIEELVIRWFQLEKGKLETGLSALKGASLDNTVYMFGEALLSPHSSNHTIIFSGGQASDYTTINRIWRFNARNQTWVREGTMQHGRFFHAVSVVRVKDFCPDAWRRRRF